MSDSRVAIIKIGKEITGVFASRDLLENDGFEPVDITVVDFSKVLAPWENKVVELIDQRKLIKIA
jgi:hypothetical protein